MRSNPLTRLTLVAIAAVAAGCAGLISHPVVESRQHPHQRPAEPIPLRLTMGKLPADHSKWGAFNGVAIDNDGRSVWVVDRCGANPDVPPGASPFQYDSCAGRAGRRCTQARCNGNT